MPLDFGEGPRPKSLFEIDKELSERKPQLTEVNKLGEKPSLDDDNVKRVERGEDSVPEYLRPALNCVEENSDELAQVKEPSKVREWFVKFGEKMNVGKEKMNKGVKDSVKSVNKFVKENDHEFKKRLGKTSEERWRKKMLVLLLTGIAIVGVHQWGSMFTDLFKHDPDGDVPPEGSNEPNHSDYEVAALYSWQKYQREGPTLGSMLDPLAVSDFETKLVTGYIPGWFCVSERVSICEQMINEKLDLPEDESERIVFFLKMQENWDEEWWPKVQSNPNLSKEVKDFYNPENRANLRKWYREQYPITPTSEIFLKMRGTVADRMFLDLMESGKVVPNRPDALTYSHLLGSFVAAVYTIGQPLLFPMSKTGFVPEVGGVQVRGGMLPQEVRDAYVQIEKISKTKNYDLLDLEPYTKVINQYHQRLEADQKLKVGSLGRV